MVEDGQNVGFSIDLWASVMTDLGQSYEFIRADSFKDMLDMVSSDEVDAFEAGDVNVVVFDAPILAYYVTTDGAEIAKLAGPVFLPESYGIALQSGSPLAEEINQSLLRLRENGTYEAIRLKWFGPASG